MGKWDPVEVWKQTVGFLVSGEFERLPITQDCVVTEPGMGSHIGWDEEHRQWARDYVAAFSNLKSTFTNSVAQGNKCAVEVHYQMDHTGPLKWVDRTIPATGKHIDVRVAYFVTFDREGEGALICKIHQHYDPNEMFQQMGDA